MPGTYGLSGDPTTPVWKNSSGSYLERPEKMDVVVTNGVGKNPSPQAIVDGDTEGWRKTWWLKRGEATAPWREDDVSGDLALAPLEPRLIKRVVTKIKRNMATGIDALPPIAISWLFDELLHALSTFLAMVEDVGVWPSQISTLIIRFIPKVSGGRRPIGLLATLVEV